MKSFFLMCLQAIPLTQAGEEIREPIGGEGIKAELKPGCPQLRANPGSHAVQFAGRPLLPRGHRPRHKAQA